jgi:hypothetical protein
VVDLVISDFQWIRADEIERLNKLLVDHVQKDINASAASAVGTMYGALANLAKDGDQRATRAIRHALGLLEQADKS